MNKDTEIQLAKESARLKETTNQWERVVSNVEINQANYVGTADVSRMRQAMVARKNDITKGNQTGKKFTL